MRVLIIDNYDSYTYNLFQLFAEVGGEDPVVLRNDADPAPDLTAYDCVIISPGPGAPTNAADFGLSAGIIADATIPLLGVCLGHQGIAVDGGSLITRAPQPRHGQLSAISHLDVDIFQGLPQRFLATRYHSLSVVEPLPASVQAIAWSEDGVVMGLRHRMKPAWGVQFHPESIETQFGAELAANFLNLAREYARPSGPQVATVTSPLRARPQLPPRYQLHVRSMPGAVDTQSAFAALFADNPRPFWLDSAAPGRFSFLGDGSGPLAEFVRYRLPDRAVEIEASEKGNSRVAGSVFEYLREELLRRGVDGPPLPFGFGCGYVGYFGYELKADCGAATAHDSDIADACWLFADRMIAVDHERDRTYVLALSEIGREGMKGDEADAQCWIRAAADRLTSLTEQTGNPLNYLPDTTNSEPEPGVFDRSRAGYLADVRTCQELLRAGESYEICLTTTARAPVTGPELDYYLRLRSANPAPYAAFLAFGNVTIACASPERFLSIDEHGTVEAKPIKGTMRRGGTAEEDASLSEQLASDPKARAENLMIVDLLRNDLGRVCEVGSVRVPRLMAVESYATVHQLVSTVSGRLRPDMDPIDCVTACFPPGSMTGAPKLRTMAIIDDLENGPRGVYSGALGYLGLRGAVDLNVVIRTAVSAGGQWRIGAGGAIVLASDPDEEYDEMRLKAAATLAALPTEPEAADPLNRAVTAQPNRPEM